MGGMAKLADGRDFPPPEGFPTGSGSKLDWEAEHPRRAELRVEAGQAYGKALDILEDDRELRLLMVIPGMATGKPKVEVDGEGRLLVHAPECGYYRSFILPDDLDRGAMEAKLEGERLEIRVPRLRADPDCRACGGRE